MSAAELKERRALRRSAIEDVADFSPTVVRLVYGDAITFGELMAAKLSHDRIRRYGGSASRQHRKQVDRERKRLKELINA